MKAPVLCYIDGRCWFLGNVWLDIELYHLTGILDFGTVFCPGVTFDMFRQIRDWKA